MTPRTYNYKAHAKGDTIRAKSIAIVISTGATIASASMTINDKAGNAVYSQPLTVTPTLITIQAVAGTETITWPIGMLYYDIRFVRSDGIIRRYLKGNIPILEIQTES